MEFLMIKKLAILAIAILTVFTGCGDNGKSGGSSKKDNKDYVIAVIPKGTAHSYWLAAESGAKKADKETDGISVIWKGIDNENDSSAQVALVQDFIQQGVDAIAISPLNADALVNVIKVAYDKGIKILVWDSDLNTDKRHCYIATDNYKGGVLCADKIGELLGGKGKVVMIRYNPGSASTGDRESGFIDRMKKKYPDVKLVSTEEYANGSASTAKEKINAIFSSEGTEIDAIFCPALPVVQGVLQAVRARNLNGKIKIVGFDQDKELVDALASGDIQALAVQDPFSMGMLSVKYGKDLLDGKKVEAIIDTGVKLIIKETMDEEDSKRLLNPDLSHIK
jgi:ribose transport system substrate-binding protein